MPASIQFQELIEESVDKRFFNYLAIKTSTLKHSVPVIMEHLDVSKLSNSPILVICYGWNKLFKTLL